MLPKKRERKKFSYFTFSSGNLLGLNCRLTSVVIMRGVIGGNEIHMFLGV
jgi:hypothetical protein